ncbi:hypothetical protein ABWE90_01385 [Pasteurella multocida]|uniref:hypothetical protein n=1 Tax=Pasteurella multocida TaxID=747 RepID=UPI0002839186|nr:hypothetical protein [Pasteurella multocida]ARB76458.1 hypothetical protein A6J57_09570 [Pasteurella multocida]EJZ80311.1 hypothetical protein P1059_00749 [Pasteurella multocida subsp. gallicida P1059]NMR51791.1 hypothetical protein [Pasteurella multocida]NMR61731.1 hypothetical protein [Pasteurella multocida]OBP30581.1 hypothetical protein A0R67_04135 [Pasteurella multocida subsp. multocida]
MWKIENEQELTNFIQQLKNGSSVEFDKIDFSFLNQLKIKVQGDPNRYNGSLNFAICKGICEYQNEIWKAYAEIKAGVPDLRKLTQKEKEALEIQFEINDGCTQIIANLTEFCNSAKDLVKEVTNGMTGNQKVLTIIALTICAGLYFGAEKYIENQSEIEVVKIQSEKDKVVSENETQKLDKILSTIQEIATESRNPRFKHSIEAIESHTQKGFAEIARSVSDADEVTFTQIDNSTIQLKKPQLEKIVEDLDKQEKAQTLPEALDLYIDGVKRQEGKISIFARTISGETFTANIDPDMLGDEGVNTIIDRIKDINTIKLSGMIKRRAGKIEQATFSAIVTEE